MNYCKIIQYKKLADIPGFIPDNVCYETLTGSIAYGASTDMSDMDVMGFCIPPKTYLFPHLSGEIEGYDKIAPRFDVYQQHHIQYQAITIDMNMYNITKYFRLCEECNPNMLQSLFSPDDCVLNCNQIGNMVRKKRHLFLSKKCWITFKGYAYSNLKKIASKERENSKRAELIEKFGYDTKDACALIRLLLECEQILLRGDIDMRENAYLYKAIRQGQYKEAEILRLSESIQKRLDNARINSKIAEKPDKTQIKRLLLDCLEHHYGSLSNAIVMPDKHTSILLEIKRLLNEI